MTDANASSQPSNFIRTIITEDVAARKNQGRVTTRFPPEPNGYLHIGHAKSICLNFGMASEFGGDCHLRFDDTNPTKEDVEYVDSIQEDVHWLGFDWGNHLYFASDYFEKLYDFAEQLIKKGKAFVCELSAEQMREYRGTLTAPGKESPFRDRSVDENLDLFRRMRQGEFADGACMLRAKIDMASPNINMRDPVIYRIRHQSHHRTGSDWCIYPMYDFTHCLSDMIEGITHSLCTLEFQDNRHLYDWILDTLDTPCHPQQIEFARLNLSHTVMSKRKLLRLVQDGHVSGWDDPRMPTISGLRRRGYTPASIRNFCERIGVAKADSLVDIALLEFCVREDLNRHARRVMGILNPLKIVIENYPEAKTETFEAPYHPEDESMGKRSLPFSREIYIEQDDFMEDPPKKFHRLAPGREIRLKHAYYIRCEKVIKDPHTGEVVELRCTYDPETRGGWSSDGRKVKGTSHWVSVPHALPGEVRLFDHLFTQSDPKDIPAAEEWATALNPDSLKTVQCALEPGLAQVEPGSHFQFERIGYFCVDPDSRPGKPVFNRTVTLRDTWAKIQKKTST